MEITLSRLTLKKAIGIFLVIALFFGMSSPALPYLPKVSFEAGAVSDNVITSGNCGAKATYKLYDDGRLVVSGSGEIGGFDSSTESYYEFNDFIRENSTSVYIEDGIIGIIEGIFGGFKNIKTVEMSDSVTRFEVGNILGGVFSGCEKLENIKLSKNLTCIPFACFVDCTSLKSIEIPDSVTRICQYAFEDCTSLKSIVIPESVTLIESGTFYGCSSMTSIKIGGETIQELTIEENAFYDCSSLESVTILYPSDCDADISYECGIPKEAIYYGYEDSELEWFTWEVLSRFRVYCPHENTEEVDALAASCYSYGHEAGIKCNDCGRWAEGGKDILASHLDENADKICDRCKKTMPYLERSVGGNIEEISGLTNDGITYCDDKARAYIYNDGTIEIFGEGEVTTNWWGGAGPGYTYSGPKKSTNKIIIYDGIRVIPDNCFEGFIYIEEIVLPESVRLLGENAFNNCIRLSKITILNPMCTLWFHNTVIPENVVIYGYSGSTAEKYAKDWLRKFVPLDKEHDHEFESKVVVRATCTETGVEEFTCYCGETYTEVVPMYRHYDIDKNDCCDVCDIKLNSFVTSEPDNGDNGSTNKPDDNEGTTAPEEDNTPQEPEENNVFGRFLESIKSFLENLFKFFYLFKN